MANISDAEKIAREELFPQFVNGWSWPGRWDNEGLHKRLLRLAEEQIAANEKGEEEAKPVEEAKKRATGRRPSTSSAEGPAPAEETEDVE